MYIELTQATFIKRDERGVAWSWVSGETIECFYSAQKFIEYINKNARRLKDAVAFTGSASQIQVANELIATAIREQGVK